MIQLKLCSLCLRPTQQTFSSVGQRRREYVDGRELNKANSLRAGFNFRESFEKERLTKRGVPGPGPGPGPGPPHFEHCKVNRNLARGHLPHFSCPPCVCPRRHPLPPPTPPPPFLSVFHPIPSPMRGLERALCRKGRPGHFHYTCTRTQQVLAFFKASKYVFLSSPVHRSFYLVLQATL